MNDASRSGLYIELKEAPYRDGIIIISFLVFLWHPAVIGQTIVLAGKGITASP